MGGRHRNRTTALQLKNRLKALRAEHDLSQAELAERVCVSRQTINALEVERYDPSLPLAYKLARLFGCRIEEIFFLEDESL
ncbi:MAG TPA: helix-turn-helix transcriptional regulator [Candidatus Acidoferrales bacterium]|nr:helix-turn-helix transcriptional regulator [Candidatus Acidoferrales bacterium]